MPCRAKLDAPGTLHQVMVRGIEKRQIVNDVADRKNFVKHRRIFLPAPTPASMPRANCGRC